jgi:hypothetical protein
MPECEKLAELEYRMSEGDLRMSKIESELGVLTKLSHTLDGVLKASKYITGLGLTIVALFIWILLEKNTEFKEMQTTLKTQGETMIQLIHSHQELEKDTQKDITQIREVIKERK